MAGTQLKLSGIKLYDAACLALQALMEQHVQASDFDGRVVIVRYLG
jgi:hypothetical protein